MDWWRSGEANNTWQQNMYTISDKTRVWRVGCKRKAKLLRRMRWGLESTHVSNKLRIGLRIKFLTVRIQPSEVAELTVWLNPVKWEGEFIDTGVKERSHSEDDCQYESEARRQNQNWQLLRSEIKSCEEHEMLTCVACGQDGSREATQGTPNRAKTVCDQASARL